MRKSTIEREVKKVFEVIQLRKHRRFVYFSPGLRSIKCISDISPRVQRIETEYSRHIIGIYDARIKEDGLLDDAEFCHEIIKNDLNPTSYKHD